MIVYSQVCGCTYLLCSCHCIIICHASYLVVLWKRRVISSNKGLMTCLKLTLGTWSSKWGLGVQRRDPVRMKKICSRYHMYELSRCCIAIHNGCMLWDVWVLLNTLVWICVILNVMNNIMIGDWLWCGWNMNTWYCGAFLYVYDLWCVNLPWRFVHQLLFEHILTPFCVIVYVLLWSTDN